jgi:hypothetical protein
MARQDATGQRAARLVDTLRGRREQGGDAYPLTVARLKELAEPDAADADVFKALAKKPFAQQIVVAGKKDPASPIALAEDAAALAASPLLLEYVLGKVCSPEQPLAAVAKLAKKIEKALQEPFAAALARRVEANDWPQVVGVHPVRGKPFVYLKKYPPPPPPKTPAAELAEKLVRTLEAQKGGDAGAYPVSLNRLLELADAAAAPSLRKKALAEEAFRGRVVLAVPGKPDAPVALAEDRDALAGSWQLLEYLLGTAKKHPVALDRLAEPLPEELRQPFAEAVRRHAAAHGLPRTVGARREGDTLELYLREKLPPAVVLREHLLATLREHRERGGADYPTTLARLVHHAAADAAPEAVEKALGDKKFRNEVVRAADSRESPVALKGDEERLAGSDLLLEFAVGQVSTAEEPQHPPARIARKLDKALREPFLAAVARRIEANDLPPAVAVDRVKNKPHLRLARHAPPPPPRDPAEALGERLLETLRAQRTSPDYPVPLARLAGDGDPKAVKKALGRPAFRGAALVVDIPEGETLALLAEDRDRVAGDPRLVRAALAAARTPDNQALPAPALAKKVAKELREPFAEAVERQAAGGNLPPGVGSLRIGNKPYLFLLSDVGAPAVREPAPAPQPPPAIDFASMFDAAFERLDRQKGSHNLVSLVTLREEVPVDRPTFDAELHELRRVGRYSLSGAEGRHGLSPEERAAGIEEGGALLLFVSRRE